MKNGKWGEFVYDRYGQQVCRGTASVKTTNTDNRGFDAKDTLEL